MDFKEGTDFKEFMTYILMGMYSTVGILLSVVLIWILSGTITVIVK